MYVINIINNDKDKETNKYLIDTDPLLNRMVRNNNDITPICAPYTITVLGKSIVHTTNKAKKINLSFVTEPSTEATKQKFITFLI